MKAARLVVIVVALGSGLAAAVVANSLLSKPDAPTAPVTATAPPPPRQDTVDVLVVNRDLPMGTKVTAADVSWQAWPKSSITDAYVTKDNRPDAIDQAGGSMTRQSLSVGEPLRDHQLIKSERGYMSVILTPGMRAVAVEVKAASTAGGFVLPNDRVDIILTRAAPKATAANGDPYISETILTNVRVLAIDQQAGEKTESHLVARETATLELTPRQAERVAQAQQLGTVSLSLRSIQEAATPTSEDEQDTPGAVRIVRYGITSRVTTTH